jgi:hypothetical protein
LEERKKTKEKKKKKKNFSVEGGEKNFGKIVLEITILALARLFLLAIYGTSGNTKWYGFPRVIRLFVSEPWPTTRWETGEHISFI